MVANWYMEIVIDAFFKRVNQIESLHELPKTEPMKPREFVIRKAAPSD